AQMQAQGPITNGSAHSQDGTSGTPASGGGSGSNGTAGRQDAPDGPDHSPPGSSGGGQNQAPADTWSGVDSMTDVTNSDGSQHITREETYASGDGTVLTASTTHAADGQGNVTATQAVAQTNPDGAAVSEATPTTTASRGATTDTH